MNDTMNGKHELPKEICRNELIRLMINCPQTAAQNVLQHGRSVWACFERMMQHILEGTQPEGWRVPEWAFDPRIRDHLAPDHILVEYAVFHDCGKPFTRRVDENGRQHFPGHAEASEKIWLAAGGDPWAARLMSLDMLAHTMKGEAIREFASLSEAPSLLMMAIAEIHSNAEMFGGLDSDSFKIKIKNLSKRGRQALNIFFEKQQYKHAIAAE